jgi:serine/alanine adding enzyme
VTSTRPASASFTATAAFVVERFSGSQSEWDAFAARSEDATFCHLYGWRDVMAGVLGHESLFLGARDSSGALRGILPLVRVRSRLFGHYLVSLPFLNYGGPIGDREAQRALSQFARDEAARSRADLLELRARHVVEAELTRRDRKVTVLLPLRATSDELFSKQFSAKLRSQIRKPQKEGLQFRVGGAELVKSFYAVFAEHMRDLGTPALPRALFEALPRHLGDHVVFGVVLDGDRPVAVGCGFVWRDEFEITWASALRSHAKQAPNMLLYWGLMEHAIGLGLKTFNFGRCTPDSGTHKFKLQWGGAHTVPLPWLQWSKDARESTPTPDSGAYKLAVQAWQKLPLSVTNLIGPALARRIP